MPVYNEMPFLKESLDSILAQTYPNVEILIADNASTDGTSDLCAEYAAKHKNIRHIRHAENIGQSPNFKFLPHHAHGTYFCWAAGHDLWEKTFAEQTVDALEANPDAVLATTRSVYIHPDGSIAREESRYFDLRGKDSASRFLETMWRVDCNYVYGVFRLAPMLQSKLFQVIPAADRVFLAEMAAKGPFVPVDAIRKSRWNRGKKQTELEKRHRIMSYLHPGKTFSDAELTGNEFYRPTQRAFIQAAKEAHFPWYQRPRVALSVWLCGVMKSHLFPGADVLSEIVKKVLPKSVLEAVLRRMR